MEFITLIIKSFSQVFLQESVILGSLIIIGLAIVSPVALLLALTGSITAYIASLLSGFPKELIVSGAFGFNGVLIGIAVSLYVKNLPQAILLTVLFSLLGVGLYWILNRFNISPFTAPFVMATWIFILFSKTLK